MSATSPIIASSSSTMSLPSREMTGTRLFQFYMESFFKIPKDLKNDIIYCQRALKAHIKVHQMVLDVFQQQPDADPRQKKSILDELETEIYEINAEQNFLFLRLRRIIDEFFKMLKKNGIPTDSCATNAMISKEIVPLVNDTSVDILPKTVQLRNNEEKLIEKYFEVQKDQQTQLQPQIQFYDNMEVIDLDDDDKDVEKEVPKVYGKCRVGHKKEYANASAINGESLLKNVNANITQPSLLKPFNQRMTHEMMNVDVKPKLTKTVTTLGDIYQQKKEEKEKVIELPVSKNVKMSRMNLRQALKRAQAAVRGPTTVPSQLPPPTLSSQLPPPTSSTIVAGSEVVKKPTSAKAKGTRAAAAAAAAATAVTVSKTSVQKSPERSSSSEECTSDRFPSPPHNYWPDELEETRTKAEEYGQEMFLRLFDLYTPEIHAKLQQRRSKRRRRCVQNNNYHYGKIEHHSLSSSNEPETKKKRKTFLLSPQVKKALPPKRTKRRSADNLSETNSAPPSRSASNSPHDKRSCNECLKFGFDLEQCEECNFYYHAQCHRDEDDKMVGDDLKKILNETKKCPGCKRNYYKAVKQELLLNKNLQRCVEELKLQIAKEKDRREILQRTGKSYKIQMNNLFKIVNSFKTESSTPSAANFICDEDVIQLD